MSKWRKQRTINIAKKVLRTKKWKNVISPEKIIGRRKLDGDYMKYFLKRNRRI
jgi:ribosomal protein S4